MTFQPEPGAASHPPRSLQQVSPIAGPESVRVLLCEDNEIYRIGLRALIELEPDLVVVGEVVDAASACSLADRVDPHIVVIRQGLLQHVQGESVSELCSRGRAVLILAETESELDLAEALRAGVRGYLSRWVAAPRLVDGIRALSKDELVLDPAFARHLVQFLTAGPTGPAEIPPQLNPLSRLTERQRAVALLVAEGMTNGEIAARLFVSDATVKSHITAVLRRLGIRSRTQLAIFVNNNVDDGMAGGAYSRHEMHQASGMVAAQLSIGLDDALLVLRGRAFSSGRSVGEVAADVVARRPFADHSRGPGRTPDHGHTRRAVAPDGGDVG